jgi:hypothetical protein
MAVEINSAWARYTGYKNIKQVAVYHPAGRNLTLRDAYAACVAASAQAAKSPEEVAENLKELGAALSRTRTNILVEAGAVNRNT